MKTSTFLRPLKLYLLQAPDESTALEIIFSPWGTNNFNETVFVSFDDLKINIESVTGFVF